MKRQMLSSNELVVLRVLWSENAPLSRPEILGRIPDNRWNPNSIHVVLNNLIKKEYVEVAGVARCGQSYGRTYRAAKTQGEYITDLAMEALPDTPEEECILDVMSAMVKRKNVGEETLNQLEQMLAQRRKELRQETDKQSEQKHKQSSQG